ncbi:TnsA endonuclease N-terminal domain-containing protein [Vibrio sp. CAU 1672]|uniref:TnsA endonuclease N-terminal domain-containing protein n=1 Tax=Vibrio sp. CAU 1672 TaxID=3032594 RepID=UPI0023DAEFFD|nr:TnsA endonuclease N-terminal domain-containing protein [Vibrio sp. CAU 1672]MDF2152886.1 TnsA endonuclease N-terminal domain-containing protein [Vibrio sp. CAU 1672]
MYIRDLRKASPNKNVFKFASVKNKESVMCESSLERDCCYHFEYDREVVHYESQPEGYFYEYCGKRFPYTPDFLVTYIDGDCRFVEIKPYDKTFDKDFQRKFEARKRAAEKLGIQLILVTDRQIRNGYFLKNCELVHRYSGCIEDNNLIPVVYEYLCTVKEAKIYELAESLKVSICDVFVSVLRLISRGVASTDLDLCALSESSIVRAS